MAFPIETLETFFGAKFQFEQLLGQLTHFDGYAYWHVLWMPTGGEFLKIAADSNSMLGAFPTVEIEGRYADDVSVVTLSGGVGVALVLHPKRSDKPMNYVTITKTKEGRLSLSITVGEAQSTA
jgi:hypothetical protein